MPDTDLLELELPDEPTPPVDETDIPTDETETHSGEAKSGEAGTKTPVTSLFQPDGKKLDPQVREKLVQIKTENPELGKLLTKAVYRVAELDREFPGGLTEVRELRDKVETLGGVASIETAFSTAKEFKELAALFESSDPGFVDDMIQSNPEAFAALAPTVFARYAETNPEGFAAYVGRVVYGDMQRASLPLLMMRLADTLGENAKALEVFNQINDYLGSFKALAEKPQAAPKPAGKPQAKDDDLKRREDELRAKEWRVERDSLQRSITDEEYRKALAGRKPGTEERGQIRELFLSRSKAAADRLFPGWQEKAQRFISSNDRTGYLRYIGSIYRRIVPEAMASAVGSTMKGKPGPKPGAAPGAKPTERREPANGAQAPSGFGMVAKEPSSWDIDYNRTNSAMLRENRAVLKDGKKVTWK